MFSSARHDPLFTNLTPHELFWKSKRPQLLDRGYELRPRYRPDWEPSWLKEGAQVAMLMDAEDSWRLPARRGKFTDATRVSDGKLVYLKQVPADGADFRFMAMLSSDEYRKDPQNHCVPLLDYFVDDEDPALAYIVMPFLRRVDDPEFESVGEFMEFVDQLLEGLVFLHRVGVAHRDCAYGNIMMDPSSMYPNGYHPVLSRSLPDFSGPAWPTPRSSASVQYYYIDFGISSYFPPGETDTPIMVQGTACRDTEPPELHLYQWYDPFALDVFLVGNCLRRRFLDEFSNLSFLAPLVERMVADDPSQRPDANSALQEWNGIRHQIGIVAKLWRLRRRHDSLPIQLGMDAYGLVKTGLSNTRWRRYL